MTKQEKYAKMFEEKAGTYYNGKYDYSKVVYTRARDKVVIVCPEHGDFTKTPNKHLRGQGCPDCSNMSLRLLKMKPFEEFEEEASELHNAQYSYVESTYGGAKVKMTMICPEHGEFSMAPDKHINRAQGCRKCGMLKATEATRSSTQEFIQKSNTVHKGRYSYESTTYTNSTSDLIVTCPVHGEFTQNPSNHLAGKGCRKCTHSGGGFDASKAGKLYYISIDSGKYYKIGITNRTVWQRFSKDEHHRIVLVKEWDYPLGRDAQLAENAILREHKNSIIPKGEAVLRDGNTEIFIEDVLGLDPTTQSG